MPGTPSPEELLADGVAWTVLVPRTRIGGHAANGFTVDSAECFTHLRLSQYPDGGIARLRVHGEAAPDPAWLAALGTFDLAALENGGHAEDASDRFYSSPANGIHPGRSRKMDDGWETRRRRDRGHDWVRYRLAGQSVPRAVEIDTGCYKGNAAGWAELWGLDATTGADPGDHTTGWTPPAAAHPPPAGRGAPLHPDRRSGGHTREAGHLPGRRRRPAARPRLVDEGGERRLRGA
ncbi:hypothetical protein GCM10020000_16610 [Streptomyces olivoverticillatus]